MAAYLSTVEVELLLRAALYGWLAYDDLKVSYDAVRAGWRTEAEVENRVGALARLKGLGLFRDCGHEPWPDTPTARPLGSLEITDVGYEVAIRLLATSLTPRGQVRAEGLDEPDPIRARFAPLTEGS